MTEIEAIEIIKYASAFNSENSPLTKALNMAIEALEKQIPKKPVIKPWNPARCPACGEELSESMGDGYYKHLTLLQRCPNPDCGQRLLWESED